jgi:L-lactate dehydrogenase complex protein LldG
VTARDEVLARIRVASGPGAGPGAGPAAGADGSDTEYRMAGGLTETALLELLADRLTHYRALVRLATPETLAAEVAAALAQRQARRIVVPPELDLQLPADTDVTADDGLSATELDGFDGVITRAALAIAETGTVVLDGSPDQGRRAISLMPDYHLCVVEADQVVELVPEAVARLADAATRPLTWISGPSATSDIELERVEGVHGPRTLEVILVLPPAPSDPASRSDGGRIPPP